MATHEAGETQSVGKPDIETVANQFVAAYYQVLHKSPEMLHRFYTDDSVLKWPGAEAATTLQEIEEKIMSSVYRGCEVKIVHADAQESLMDGVIMNISGCLSGDDKVKRIFTQTFFLAKQEKGFYVLNDNFRVLDTNELLDNSFAGESEEVIDSPAEKEVVSAGAAPTDAPSAQPEPEKVVTVPAASVEKTPAVASEAASVEKTPVVASDTASVQKTPVVASDAASVQKTPVVASEASKEAVPVTQNVASTEKPEAKKFSYASMVAKETPIPENSVPKIVRVAPTSNHQDDVRNLPSTGSRSITGNKTKVSHGAKDKNAANNDFRSEASLSRTVYVRGLPSEITKPELADALKQFGQVKLETIQIKNFEDGFCFGFVEFESDAMAKAAVQAHNVVVNGAEAHISLKKSKPANNGPRTGGGFRGNGGGRGGEFRGQDNGGEFHSNGGGRGGEFRGQGHGGAERPKRDFGFRNNRDGSRAQGAGGW